MTNTTNEAPLEKARILIVDDVPENIKILGNFLKNNGFAVLPANNGKQALDLAAAKVPDLILLDIQMPEMDGYTVCTELKKMHKTKDIPVIFLTARTENQDMLKGFETGGVDYITKPFEFSELRARIFVHLELKFARDLIQHQKSELLTAYLKLQEEEKKTIDLEKTKSVLAMIVTANHEINQPLQVVSGYLDMLQNKLKDKLDEKDKTYFHKIEEGIYGIAETLKKYKNIKNFDYKDYYQGIEMVVFKKE